MRDGEPLEGFDQKSNMIHLKDHDWMLDRKWTMEEGQSCEER